MVIRVEHPLHERRRGRNKGLGLILVGFVALVFGLTVVKVLQLGDVSHLQAFDHSFRPGLIPIEEPLE